MEKKTKTAPKPKKTEISDGKQETVVDMRTRLDKLDEATRAAYIGGERKGGYDPSVFVEAIQRASGERILYVPAAKRMKWFHVDHPTGIVVPDEPTYNTLSGGFRSVTVKATAYLSVEDYKNGIPAAINMASRPMYGDDPYALDICVTRAQSRVLRDIGYDIPGDAHEIEGWTPVTVEDTTGVTVPEDALESGVTIRNGAMPPITRLPVPAATAAAPAKAEPAPAPAPAPAVPAPAPVQAAPAPAPVEPAPKPVPTPTPAPVAPPAVAAPTPAPQSAPAAAPAAPAPAPVQAPAPAPVPVPAAPAADEDPKPVTVTALLQKSEEVIGNLDAALKCTCRSLSGKCLGELSDEQKERRIPYYVRKLCDGTMSGEAINVGYASVLIAHNMGILADIVSKFNQQHGLVA